MKPMVVSKEKVLNYLSTHGVQSNEKILMQTWDDSGGKSYLNKVIYGTIEEKFDELVSLNQKGAGVGFALNYFDGKGTRKKENVIGVRYLVLDDDSNSPINLLISPSILVKSKNGYHVYLKIKDDDKFKVNECVELNKKLSIIHNTDTSVCEPSRAMRAPYFFHRKDINDPFEVKVLEVNDVEYSLEEIKDKYHDQLNELINTNSKKKKFVFEEWFKEQPRYRGIRNKTLFVIVKRAFDRGMLYEEVRHFVEEYCSQSGLPIEEGIRILKKESKNTSTKEIKIRLYDVASNFLKEHYQDNEDNFLLKNIYDDFYKYVNGSWEKIDSEEFEAIVIRYIHTHEKLKDKKIKSYCADVIATIKSIVLLPKAKQRSFWINEPNLGEITVCLEDGLFNVNKYLDGCDDFFTFHTPKFFTTNKLPLKYDPFSRCDRWLKFLDDIFDDKEIITLLQQWFGYNLVPDTSHEKFMIFYGQGANGKGVISRMLFNLLGQENVSCLGLEAIDQTRSFALSALIGKLANIVGELNEVGKASEGLLKTIVSGESITIDRKHKDPISYAPFARFTFSTNVLPRIMDKSDGIARRLLLVQFEKQFLNESEQDKRLLDKKYWIEINELSAIFLWALEGLRELKYRGEFIKPKSVQKAISLYMKHANPTLDFLSSNYSYAQDAIYSRGDLYNEYKDWMKENGFNSLNVHNFSNEVKRAFPLIQSSGNHFTFSYINNTKRRDRAWCGLTKISDIGFKYAQSEQLKI